VLGEWLEDPQLSSIPDGFGAWAEVFTRMYKARRGSQQTEQRLSDNEQRFRRTISALPEGSCWWMHRCRSNGATRSRNAICALNCAPTRDCA